MRIYIYIYIYIHIPPEGSSPSMLLYMYISVYTYVHTYIYICIHIFIHVYIQTYVYIYASLQSHAYGTGWRRPIGCLIFVGHFRKKSPIIIGSFAENDMQLKASHGLAPPCTSIYIIMNSYINDVYIFRYPTTSAFCAAS